MEETELQEKMEENFEGWKAVQDLEYMNIRDTYESGFRHGIEAAEAAFDAAGRSGEEL